MADREPFHDWHDRHHEEALVLEGVKVIELASVITGPLAGMMLADLGATVVKVEPPGGDQFRGWDGGAGGVRPSFAAMNRGKASISLDLKSETGRTLLFELIADADVVIENSRPGAMARLGLCPDDLLAANPRLVHCSVTGMGSGSSESERPTYDAVAQAMSGLWSQLSSVEEPEVVGPPFADQLTGLYAAIGILSALRERDRVGRGRAIEVGMLGSCLSFQGLSIAALTHDGVVPGPTTRSVNSQSYAFLASDGLPFAVHLSTPQRFWRGLCCVVGKPELIDDERFATKRDRISRYAELRHIFDGVFRTRKREEWLTLLREADVPAAPILRLDEALAHPHVRALGMVEPLDGDAPSPTAGLVKSPIVADGRPIASMIGAPILGSDTDRVLAAAGHEQKEIDRLRSEGVVT